MIFSRGHALIIGVSTYLPTAQLTPLPIAARDTQAVASVLSDLQYCAYPPEQITVLENEHASLANIRAALANLAQRAYDDTVVIYYSGHGRFDIHNQYYLTACDTRTNEQLVEPGSGLPDHELLDALRKIRSKRLFLLLNACYSGAAAPQSFGPSTPADAPVPEQVIDAVLDTGSGRSIITACRQGELSYFLLVDQLSFFAEAVVSGLRGVDVRPQDGYISLFDFYRSVHRQVAQKAQRLNLLQEPEITISKGLGDIPIALYRGPTLTGDTIAENLPAQPTGSVRVVDPAASKRALDERFRIAVNINNLYAPLTVINGDVMINALPQQGRPATPQQLLLAFQQQIKQLRRHGQDPIIHDLHAIEDALKAANHEQRKGDKQKVIKSLKQAKQAINTHIDAHPWLAALLHAIERQL